MIKKSLIFLIIVLGISLTISIEPAYAVNQIKQLIKMSGTYPVDVSFFDVTISPAITNIDKTIVFVDFGHSAREDNADSARSWKLIDGSTLRLFGDGETAVGNVAVKFRIKIMEFNSTSDLLVQRDELILTAGATEQIYNQTFATPINMSNSFILPSGVNYNSTDITVGSEELAQIYLRDTTSWSYFVADTPNTGNTTARVQIIDWNSNDISVQRGSATFDSLDQTFSVTPPTAIDADTSLLLVTYSSNNGLAQDPKVNAFNAILNTATDNIDFEREGSGNDLEIRWEIIDFPTTFPIRHETGTNAGTLQNFLLTPALSNFTQTVAIGTVHSYFGDGNTRAGCNKAGCWEELMHTQVLTSNTNLAIERGGGGGSHTWTSQIFDIGQFFTPTAQVFDQIIIDTVTVAPDDPDFTITKEAVDFGSTIDLETNMNITKLGTDIASAGDTVSTGTILILNLDDDANVSEITSINVTKLAQDAVSAGDDPIFSITKLVEDIATIVDSTIVTVSTDLGILDTVTSNDVVILNITKEVVDPVLISDSVDITRILRLLLNDTSTVNDPSILFKITTIPPNGTNIPSAGSGGGTPSFQRLVGLAIISELFFVESADRVPSDFIIETFGRETIPVSITNIQTDEQFSTWFEFSAFPDTLNFDTTVDTSRTLNDPARFKNSALDDYVLSVPTQSCAELNQFIPTIPCVDPILYEVPLTFTFKKGGVEFRERHLVTIDASQPIVCDALCELVDFVSQNYWWLAGIVVVFMMLYFLGGVVTKRGIRTVRRGSQKQFDSFSGDKPRVKFKKGKR